jgi:hypothetical protein
MTTQFRLMAAALLLTLVLGGCAGSGSDDDSTVAAAADPTTSTSTTTTTTSTTTVPLSLQPGTCDEVLVLVEAMSDEDRDQLRLMESLHIGPLQPEGLHIYGVAPEIPPDPSDFSWLPDEGLVKIATYSYGVEDLTFPWRLTWLPDGSGFTCELTPPPTIPPPPAAPSIIGVPTGDSTGYPVPLACETVETFVQGLIADLPGSQHTLDALEGNGVFWFAIDTTTRSADVYFVGDRRLVKIRNGEVVHDGEPPTGEFPGLSAADSYPYVTLLYAVSGRVWQYQSCSQEFAVG